LQIGELVSILSDDFRDNNPIMQWREIKAVRNIVAHRYDQVNYDIIWDICENDVPVLMDFCTKELKEELEVTEAGEPEENTNEG